jgi:hypothetical protein
MCIYINNMEKLIKNSLALVLERTIPTERPTLADEVNANFWE